MQAGKPWVDKVFHRSRIDARQEWISELTLVSLPGYTVTARRRTTSHPSIPDIIGRTVLAPSQFHDVLLEGPCRLLRGCAGLRIEGRFFNFTTDGNFCEVNIAIFFPEIPSRNPS